MSHWPKRTGIPTLKRYLRAICILIAKFRPLYVTILTPDELAKVDLLVAACEAVTNDVPTYEPEI